MVVMVGCGGNLVALPVDVAAVVAAVAALWFKIVANIQGDM